MKSIIGAATAAALASVCLSGCANIISGTSQEIKVVTNPPNANCEMIREGTVIAQVYQTPGEATIKKTKDDITLQCHKEGYQDVTYLNHSGIDGATYGNMVLGGAVGWGIDSATGADNHYDGIVNVSLVPAVVTNTQVAGTGRPAGSLCTPEDLALAKLAQQNNYRVRLMCN